MLSTSDEFKSFLGLLIDCEFLNDEQIDICLEEFGGLVGALDGEYYISSYEEVGRLLVRNENIEDAMESLSQAGCFTNSAEQYYFFWAVFDEYIFNGGDLRVFLSVTPEKYLPFLKREFRIT